MIADHWEISRSELDELGVRSQQRAVAATEEGRFEREVIPWELNGDTVTRRPGPAPGHRRWRASRS